MCYICISCKQSIDGQKLPEYSTANGYDYGDLNRMPVEFKPLTFAESYLINSVRMYGSIIKIKQHKYGSKLLHGNIISFVHDGPEAAIEVLNSLPNIKATDQCKVMFFGEKKAYE